METITTRRNLLAGAALAGTKLAPSTAQGANERLGVALIGPGGMGSNHLRELAKRTDIRLVAVCDVDSKRLAAAKELSKAELATGDMRQVLDRKDVHAVFIATPDHWHAPAAILAANAGKHVYVEKPGSHNIREGRLMIEAARRNKVVMQVGTQTRSSITAQAAIAELRSGAIGEILVAKAINSQRRGNIGKRMPEPPPPELDFDTWLGPAPRTAYRSNLLHGSWRWFRDFGVGDIGNDGVHDIDVAVWGLGVDSHPETISGFGKKLFFDDDQEFPDTQYVTYEYAKDTKGRSKALIFEQRIWSPHLQETYENGDMFYGTDGYLLFGKSVGWRVFKGNQMVKEVKAELTIKAHHDDFFDAIRTGRKPNADIETHHRACTLAHLGNLVARLGRTLHFEPHRERFTQDADANALVGRKYRKHWGQIHTANE